MLRLYETIHNYVRNKLSYTEDNTLIQQIKMRLHIFIFYAKLYFNIVGTAKTLILIPNGAAKEEKRSTLTT